MENQEKKPLISPLAFELRITLIYVLTSIAGTISISLLALTLCRFLEKELILLLITLAIDLPVVGFIQWALNERWLRSIRRHLRNPNAPPDPAVYTELLEFPWKGSLLSLFLWGISFAAIILSRIFFLSPLPIHRTVILGMAILSGAFLAWPLQYFLFHSSLRSILDRLPHPESFLTFRFLPIVRKYTLLFGSLLLGATLFGATLFTGTLYNVLLTRAYKGARNLVLLQRQEVLRSPQLHLPSEYTLSDKPSSDALPVETFLEERQMFLGIPVYVYELQEIPASFAFYTPLELGGAIRYLEYRLPTAQLRSRVTEIPWQLGLICLFLSLFFAIILVLIFLDITRPLRGLHRELPDPDIPYKTPEILLSDDEHMETVLMVRQMFQRFHQLTEKISTLFWNFKDTHREITQDFLSLSQFSAEQNKIITSIGQEFSSFREKTYDQLQLNKNFRTDLQETIQKLSLFQARWDQHTIHIAAIAQGLDSIQKINREKKSLVEQLHKQIQYLLPRIHQILQRERLLTSTITRLTALMQTLDSAPPLEFREFGLNSRDGLYDLLKELDSILQQFEDFEHTCELQIHEVTRVCEAIDVLGFEALLLSTQEVSDEAEFRVVGEEVRDLASRALMDVEYFFQKLKELTKLVQQDLLSLHQTYQKYLILQEEQGELAQKLNSYYEQVTKEKKYDYNFSHFKRRLEEMIHHKQNRLLNLHHQIEEHLNIITQLLDLLQGEADRHLDLLNRLSEESLAQKAEFTSTSRELESWIRHFFPLDKHLDLLGKLGMKMAKQLDLFFRHFSELRDLSGQKSEWWSSIRTQLESMGREISHREVLMKKITQAISQKK